MRLELSFSVRNQNPRLGPAQREAATFVPCFRERERERERALIGFSHNGGSRASPAHGLRITITEEFDSVREEEGEEEEDVFVFNDTIEGSRAPAVKPGRVTQA